MLFCYFLVAWEHGKIWKPDLLTNTLCWSISHRYGHIHTVHLCEWMWACGRWRLRGRFTAQCMHKRLIKNKKEVGVVGKKRNRPHLHEVDILCLLQQDLGRAEYLLGLLAPLIELQDLSGVFLAVLWSWLFQHIQSFPQVLLQELLHFLILQAHLLFQLIHLILYAINAKGYVCVEIYSHNRNAPEPLLHHSPLHTARPQGCWPGLQILIQSSTHGMCLINFLVRD